MVSGTRGMGAIHPKPDYWDLDSSDRAFVYGHLGWPFKAFESYS